MNYSGFRSSSFPDVPPSSFPHVPLSSPHPQQINEWSWEENKLFEVAISEFGIETPNLFEKIASRVPGKTIDQIQKHYEALTCDIKAIESDRVPLPDYVDCEEPYKGKGVRQAMRKKGTAWSEREHRLFLLGVEKYGKGGWRDISRFYVKSRSPTQVASHAQKYYDRLYNRPARDVLRRTSIFDIHTPYPLPNLPMAQTIKAKPIMPSSVPISSPTVSPNRMNYFPVVETNVNNTLGSSIMTTTVPPSTMPFSVDPLSTKNYNEAFMNRPPIEPGNDNLSNSFMNNPHVPPINPHSQDPFDLANDFY